MAESITIARPYAEAVFRVALKGNTLPAWSKRLEFLASAVIDPAMESLIVNPTYSSAQIAQMVLSLLDDDDPQLANFIRVLADNERLLILPQICKLFGTLKSAEEGVREALIMSAFPIDKAQLKTLTHQLEQRFGSRLLPRVMIDANLIGGIKVAVGDQVFDASIRSQIEAMTTALMN